MLFNRENQGKEEMKSHLGFIYATNSFDNLKTDLLLAEDEMRLLIGDDLFDKVEEYYQTGPTLEPTPEETMALMLVPYIQAPMAFYAYRNYATHGDLAHSEKGRRILVSEMEKMPFEWMIERDDQSMLSKAHKLSDRLLTFLERNKGMTFINDVWTSKPVYQATKKLFINSAVEFDQVFPIDQSRRFFLKVVPFIREIEQSVFLSVIGKTGFDALKLEISGESEMAEDTPALLSLIRVPLVLYTMGIALHRLSVEVLPEGIFQNYVPETQTIRAKSVSPIELKNQVAAGLKSDADNALIKLQELLSRRSALANGSDYTVQDLSESNSVDNKFFSL